MSFQRFRPPVWSTPVTPVGPDTPYLDRDALDTGTDTCPKGVYIKMGTAEGCSSGAAGGTILYLSKRIERVET